MNQAPHYSLVFLLFCTTGFAAAQSVIVGRPTDHSVTLNALSPTDTVVSVEYGSRKTPAQTLTAGVPTEFELTGLKPNTRYTYRVGSQEGTFQTQRAPGSAFTFGVQGDLHPERPGKMLDAGLYAQTLRNVAKDAPDFYVLLGDDFSIERLIERQTLSQAAVDRVYADQRRFLSVVGAPLFLVNGNHEQAARCNLDGTAINCAVFAGKARTKFFPLPAPDGFYTGDAEPVEHIGLLRDYYTWTWGDALFVVIDPYWHSPVAADNKAGSRQHDKGKRQGGTLGDAQYRWLAKTLTESKARWKFVFAHHVNGTGRGGIECATRGEWGTKIHSLFVKSGVTIYFQGHGHLFARQELDGVSELTIKLDSGLRLAQPDLLRAVHEQNAEALRALVKQLPTNPGILALPALREALPAASAPNSRGQIWLRLRSSWLF